MVMISNNGGAWAGHLGTEYRGDVGDWVASKKQKPLWSLVPDKVADRDVTLARWKAFSPIVRAHGIRPAFAVQDDMTFDDVPDSECMLFLGYN